MDIEANKQEFGRILAEMGIPDTAKIIDGLDKLGFFSAPASSKHHLAVEGGLCFHSLNVYRQAMALRKCQIELCPALGRHLPEKSIAIAALLHDVCKAEVYVKEVKHRKNAQGRWEDYIGYAPNYSQCPLGHGEKSVIRLLKMGIDLTPDEILAIRWHMANWSMSDDSETKGNFAAATAKCPLLSLIIAADELATRITENENLHN